MMFCETDEEEDGHDGWQESVGCANYRGGADCNLLRGGLGCPAGRRAKQRCEPQLGGNLFGSSLF
jgi:hypothetical protein